MPAISTPDLTDAHGEADAKTAAAVLNYCLSHKLLLLTCGSYQNVMRWIPPLVVNQTQIDEALGIFNEAVAS